MTNAELVAEIERLERLLNAQRRAGGGSHPTLFEVQRRLDQIDQEWRNQCNHLRKDRTNDPR